MALPSSACGGSLPAPGTAAALQTRPVGWRWLEESSAHRQSALAAQLPGPEPPALSQQCRGRHAVFMQRFAARCVCSAPGQHPCSQACQEETHPQLLVPVEGEGGKLQPDLCSSLGWVRCPMMGTVWVTLLDPPGECLLCFPIPRDGSWGAVPRGGGS